MSFGCCCALRAPVVNNVSPRINSALVFVAIPESPIFPVFIALSLAFAITIVSLLRRLVFFASYFLAKTWLALAVFSVIEMLNRTPLVHLTVTAIYRID
jgi:hypothetical protein